MEKCPRCGSIFIQFNNFTDECYCLVKDCRNHWKQSLIRDKIENNYLRITMLKKRVRM